MKVLCVGDIHLADRPPSIRTDDFKEQILNKLAQTIEIADRHKVDAVVWVGDVFHVKAASRTSHALVQDIIEVGQAYHCPWIIVPGNHDLTHDRMDSLEKQPLGVLYQAGAIKGDGEITVGDGSVFCIPWLKNFPEQLPAYFEAWQTVPPKRPALMVTHAAIFPPESQPPFDEFYNASDWVEMMGRTGDVFYGHIHDNHGVYGAADGSWFCNLGAISRGSLHESTLARKPAVAVYNSDGDDPFERVELGHLPAEAVFRLAIKKADDERKGQLAEFLGTVESTELEGLSIETVLAHISSLDLDDLTRQLIQECLEEAASK